MTWLYWGIPLMIVGLFIAIFPVSLMLKRQARLIDEEEALVEAARGERRWRRGSRPPHHQRHGPSHTGA
ncbi:MAG: hypothetical protein JWO62_1573 [Acidimicrobiaceae bacterium]|jgi:hypothetical protein|nr:hypothetical protein [Acidimicrobiaceae bacterium]